MMIKCKICGCEFPPIIEKHYISRDCGKTGVSTVFNKDEEKIYDTFDCPNCGCQVILQERKRMFIPCIVSEDVEEKDDE